MSALDDPDLPPDAPDDGSDGGRPELAPSDIRADAPALTRLAGAVGLALTVAGVVSIAAAGPNIPVSAGWGYLIGTAGLALLFVHALRDSDAEIRRAYGGLAFAFLVLAVVVSLVPPGASEGGAANRVGERLLPWGATLGFLSLVFFIPFTRHETDPQYRRVIETTLLTVGGLLVVGVLIAGLIVPDFLVGPGIVLGILGVGFLALYLSVVDPAVGVGRQVAVGLGVVGVVCLAVAVGRSVVPSVLYEGPAALRTPAQTLDGWKVGARAAAVLAALGVAALGLVRSLPVWLKTMAVVFGVALAGALVVGSLTKGLTHAPAPFLVPYGLILAGLGLVYGGVSAGVASENHFVVLTRRELAAYFYSPIGYLVLFGMAAVAWIGYSVFANSLAATMDGGGIPEPITRHYMNFGILGAFTTVFLVPALTMGLFAEEKRSGTFEVLLTAPVGETTVVLSKFSGAWLFYLICWLPPGLYLVALRVAGGAAFDYRPVLTFYLALAASGAAFIAMGVFFSSLTRNQIVAAVLTFAGMMALLLTVIGRDKEFEFFGPGVRVAIGQLDFLTLWQQAALGQLAVQAVVVQLSVAVFWLFVTVKSLEVRKWS